ncbi:hypothetical protein U0070_023883, partial [Myodes glareolus]
CSQDPVTRRIVNDILTNRKESIPLQFSEVCLYLNIYTPVDLTRSHRLPVMVCIHGGGLVLGGASTYDGLALSIHENMVVMVLKYHLGIWGFFRLILDTSTEVLSPLAKNLFHRAISESEVALTDGLFKKNTRPLAEAKGTYADNQGSRRHHFSPGLAAKITPALPNPAHSGHPSSPPVVNTVHGKVLGKYVSLKGFAQPVAVFLGVPFAKPPLRSLRFAPPQPAEPWSFVKNATSYPPMCSQDAAGGQVLSELFTNRKENIPLQFSEDCFYLNIYTPANLTKNSRLPVMVWIHGGALVVGGASTYDGLALSAHENVVVVAIQYRLGIWGFFRNPNWGGLPHWPEYDQKEGYMKLGASIQAAHRLKEKEMMHLQSGQAQT